MADSRITQLTELLAPPDSGDLFVLVDISDTTDSLQGTTKKITRSNLNIGTWSKETPSGVHDGSNLTYTLLHTPIASSGRLVVQGQEWTEGVDYSYTGTTLTVVTAMPKGFTGTFIFHYQYIT